MRILLIEDDANTSKIISTILRNMDFTCDITDRAEEGVQLAKMNNYDALILDLMLTDLSGESVIQRLRGCNNKVAIIVLSAIDDINKKCECLNSGADDYVTKPIAAKELIARIKAVVRRKLDHVHSKITVGPLSIDLNTKVVSIDDKQLNLTGREYLVLELLMLKKGHVLGKEVFLNHIYDASVQEPSAKIVDVFMCKLRKKIQAMLGCRINPIVTSWGRGYSIMENYLEESERKSSQKNI